MEREDFLRVKGKPTKIKAGDIIILGRWSGEIRFLRLVAAGGGKKRWKTLGTYKRADFFDTGGIIMEHEFMKIAKFVGITCLLGICKYNCPSDSFAYQFLKPESE